MVLFAAILSHSIVYVYYAALYLLLLAQAIPSRDAAGFPKQAACHAPESQLRAKRLG